MNYKNYHVMKVLVGQPKISPHDYGRCLFQVIQTASQCSISSNQSFACAVGMAMGKENEDSTFIIRRISMLTNYPRNASKPLLGIVLAGISIIAPICVAYSAAGTLTGSHTKAIDTSHLDPEIQGIAENEINAALKHYQAKSAVIAIADRKTGTIIAFAEASKNKGQASWKTRLFPPASTIKPFIAAAAIDSGKSSATKSYECHSPYSVGGTKFNNHTPDVGRATLTEAMAKSINVCFIKAAQDTGATVVRKQLGEFGFDMNSWWQKNQNARFTTCNCSTGGKYTSIC